MRAGQFRLPEPRKKRNAVPLAIGLLVMGVIVAAALLLAPSGMGGVGAQVIAAQEGQTHEEIQGELNQEVAENMMTVSVLPTLRLDEETHELRVGLENVDDNKFAQRFTITQGETTIYESAALIPGERLETVKAPKATEGAAKIEVQALDAETLEEHGSPTAVEVSVQKAEA